MLIDCLSTYADSAAATAYLVLQILLLEHRSSLSLSYIRRFAVMRPQGHYFYTICDSTAHPRLPKASGVRVDCCPMNRHRSYSAIDSFYQVGFAYTDC